MNDEPMNPVAIEESIRNVSGRIAAGVTVCSDAYKAYLTADRAYDLAYARAYLDADGPAHERRYSAEVATTEDRTARDVADVAYRHADRLARALESELRALQSVGASVRAMYSVAGRGES
ncbi:hypothetical protein [Stackebrandtia soli]|uniref:hypothetical protein n=1 Tax=Stackebrandtia soli TaxID=1892856 RepID=UPI0039E991E1